VGKPRTVNCRMSQNPKIATIFLPGIMGSIAPPCRMLCAIISLPASPKPTANRPHIFAIEFSSRRVSICSPAASLDLDFEKKPPDRFLKPPPPTRSRSSSSESESSTWNRFSGFSETSRTFLTILSIGFNTKSCASREKNSAPAPSITHTNTVRHL